MNAHPVNKARAVAHYSQMAADARAYRAEQDRLERIAAQAQVDALLDRIREHDVSGCYAEPSWARRAESALKREFGAWWLAGAMALIAFFGGSALLVLALMGVQP